MKKLFDGFNGRLLTKQRVEKGLSKKDLGDILEVSEVSVNNWEKGNTRPKVVYVRQMNELFSVSDDYWTQYMDGYTRMSEQIEDISKREMSKKIYKLEDRVKNLESMVDSLEKTVRDMIKDSHNNKDAGYVNVNLNIKSGLIDILKEAVR